MLEPETQDWALCNEQLQEYFDIPRSCLKIDMVLSTKSHRHAYEVSQETHCYLLVEGEEEVWVDEDLAALVGRFAKDQGRRSVYMSFEFPKEVA
jgi:hypothetical protein